jgi:nucleoside 2-deoxyribosyltransferase
MVDSWSNIDGKMIGMQISPIYAELEKYTSEINRQISKFTSGDQRYAEFVMPDFESSQLTLVQTWPISLKDAKDPKHGAKGKVLESEHVVGSASIITEKVRFAGSSPNEDDVRFNRENEKYLLVVDAGITSYNFKWELKHLYNAGAVVIIVNQKDTSLYDFATHLSGYFRELGIPVMGANSDGKEKIMEIAKDSQCLVFADEFQSDGKSHGYVALV